MSTVWPDFRWSGRGVGQLLLWRQRGRIPVSVPNGLSNVVAIAAGEYHSLALMAEGRVVAWGKILLWRQRGRDSHVRAQWVEQRGSDRGGTGAQSGLTADGRVVSWGRNFEGQTNCAQRAEQTWWRLRREIIAVWHCSNSLRCPRLDWRCHAGCPAWNCRPRCARHFLQLLACVPVARTLAATDPVTLRTVQLLQHRCLRTRPVLPSPAGSESGVQKP